MSAAHDPMANLLAGLLADRCGLAQDEKEMLLAVAGGPPSAVPEGGALGSRILDVVETFRALSVTAAGRPQDIAGVLVLMSKMSYLDQDVVDALTSLCSPAVTDHM